MLLCLSLARRFTKTVVIASQNISFDWRDLVINEQWNRLNLNSHECRYRGRKQHPPARGTFELNVYHDARHFVFPVTERDRDNSSSERTSDLVPWADLKNHIRHFLRHLRRRICHVKEFYASIQKEETEDLRSNGQILIAKQEWPPKLGSC